jgi:hypothetical protein
MKLNTLAALALAVFGSTQLLGQTSTISSLAIGTQATAGGTATGVASVVDRVGTPGNVQGSVGDNLAGLQYVPGQVALDGSPASVAFFSLTGAAIPSGGAASMIPPAFASYGTLTSPTSVMTYSDVGSKLTPNSYSGLTYAAADLGFGPYDFYMIHHTPATDYLAAIVPGTGTSSSVADLKPMSWAAPGGTAGGPASSGLTGYFAISWATGILSVGAPYLDQSLYYLRTDTHSHTQFGVMIPALTGASADTLDLTAAVGSFGVGNYAALAFSPTSLGTYGSNQFYYLRQDTGPGGTGNTILGWLNPSLTAGTRTISDIANLGGVFTTLTYASDATGPAGAWGTDQFYLTGKLAAGAQSVSFAAIPNHNVGDVFTVTPTASSGLDIDLTVVSGPATIQTTGVSGATPLSLRVFTVTTTAPGIVTLQARQAGQALPLPLYTANMLRQSFDVLGLPTINSATAAAATVGSIFTYDISATGSPVSYTATPLPAGLSLDAANGVITGTPTAAATTVVTLTATNPTGVSNPATLTITVAPAAVAPIVTSVNTAAGTVGAAFTYQILATGSPTSYAASPLPAGLSLDAVAGVISGTPSAAATTVVTLSATNAGGASSPVTLTITIAPAAVVPAITSAATAPGTAGSIFVTYTIVATGSPTSYAATGLPAGLTLNSLTGAISGTPTVAGVSVVTLTATNGTGTSSPVTLTITVAAAAAVPIITSPTNAAGTVGTTFVTYTIAATGSPTGYAATGLPAGLTLNSLTGAISGTPTAAGVSVVTLTATNGTGTSSPVTLTITVAAAAAVPIITSPTNAAGAVGTTFVTYLIVATGLPTGYAASGLPAGLSLNALTGAITGTPTSAGISVVTLTATNGTGTSSPVTLTITVAPAAVAPIITSSAAAPGTVGTTFVTYLIVATGLPTSYAASGLPAGLTLNALTGAITGTPTSAGVSVVTLTATNTTGSGTATLTITIAPNAAVPIITSATTAPGTVGMTFVTYTIVATGSPTSYAASGLPGGLTVDSLTGAITGTPTTAGVSVVTLTATNGTGASSPVTLTITVAAAGTAPIITSPASAPGTVGAVFITYTIVATGVPTSYAASGLPNGLALDPLAGTIDGTPTTVGVSVVTLGATNASGTGTATLTITVAAANVVPIITSPTTNPTGTVGTVFTTYPIVATGSPTGYTATGLPAGLTINPLTGAISGTPTVSGTFVVTITATNSTGTGTSTLTIVIGSGPLSWISGFSARGLTGTGDQTLILGFWAPTGGGSYLVRGVGPGLAAYNISNALADPALTLYSSSTGLIATNNDWQVPTAGQASGSAIAAAATQVGDFPLSTGSKDAALLDILAGGGYTAELTSTSGAAGTALAEVYDTNLSPHIGIQVGSARGNVTNGQDILIAGLVISGNTPKTVLIRGIGPTLADFGVGGVLPDPTITLALGGTVVAANSGWDTGTGASSGAKIIAISSEIGAYSLEPGTKDSALLVQLQPGAYTVEVTSASSSTGVVLVEVYDAQ